VWQVIAIVALIAATAGWTTVGVMVVRPGSPPAAAGDSPDPNADNESSPPEVASHDVPALEADLPTTLSGTTLEAQSWIGDAVPATDAWRSSMTSFLTGAGKTSADLEAALASDPALVLDGIVAVYHVNGIAGPALRDAVLAAWKADYPTMKVSQTTLGGKAISKGDFGADQAASYVYVRGDLVFDVESSDECIAATALAALPGPGPAASGAPVSSGASAAPGSPAPSCSPGGSPAASPAGSPAASPGGSPAASPS
jgi:hypothetical protein